MFSRGAAAIAFSLAAILAVVGVVAVGAEIYSAPSTDVIATQRAERDLKDQGYEAEERSPLVTVKDGVQTGQAYLKGLLDAFTIVIIDGKWQPVCRSINSVDIPLSNVKLSKDVSEKRRCPKGFRSEIYLAG